ncbi:hypothetical protein F7725_008726 [Dissostichus mawsoni]|uniref:Uncharacterized protein n=1 Tax=Dissostichus mawsoni TaxID=36200 RepID=A0A7J5Y8U1_DISMA|nr:hypothetical protein F7725_008726 [Dissostichus mawsoni]
MAISSDLILPLISSPAETADDYHLDQSDGKRYSMDLGDFSSISSSYSPKSSYGFRSSQQFSGGSMICRPAIKTPPPGLWTMWSGSSETQTLRPSDRTLTSSGNT